MFPSVAGLEHNSCAEDHSPSAYSVVSLKSTGHHYGLRKWSYGRDEEGSEPP